MRCAPCQAFLVLAVAAFCAGAHAQEPYPDPRAAQARQEGLAIASRVRAQQDLLEARDAARHAENRRRCAAALRIATLCGRHAGTFSCDAKGFQPVPEPRRPPAPPLTNARRHEMDQCTRRAAQGGP